VAPLRIHFSGRVTFFRCIDLDATMFHLKMSVWRSKVSSFWD
jgi:hypothetical protein